MNVKNLTIACAIAVLTAASCKKSVIPVTNNETRIEYNSLSSLVPLGDDTDERILIKSRPKLSNGQPAVGAVVTLAASQYSSKGVITESDDLNFEIPSFGDYSYRVEYNGVTSINTVVKAFTQVTEKTDIVNK